MYKRMRKMLLFLFMVVCCFTGCKEEKVKSESEELIIATQKVKTAENKEKEAEKIKSEEEVDEKVGTELVEQKEKIILTVDKDSGVIRIYQNGIEVEEIEPVETTKKVEKVIINKTAGTARIIYDDGTETMR